MSMWFEIISLVLTLATIIFSYFKLRKQVKENRQNLEKQLIAGRENLNRKFLLNKDWQDSKSFLPIILRLSQNLLNLHYVFVHKGLFCPSIEPRIPDVKGKEAERGYQFLKMGLEIIEDAKQILYLIPSNKLPNLINFCSKLLDYLEKKEKDKQRH